MDLLQKCDPSSLMMVVLNLVKMFFFKNLITALASLIVNACAFTHFKTYSIATNMYKLLLDDTNDPGKSIPLSQTALAQESN